MGTLLTKINKALMSTIIALLISTTGFTQTNPTPQSLPYSQDFSLLAHTSNTYPAGWRGWRLDGPSSSTFNINAAIANAALTVSSNASLTNRRGHNYDGKIGMLNGANRDIALVLAINTTGATGVNVGYDIMTIRNPYNGAGATRIREVTLQYRVGTTGTFTTLTGIEYQNNSINQITAVTTPQNVQARTITLPAACDNQSEVQLRWVTRDFSGSGGRPSFAVDNVIVCAGSSAAAGADQSICAGNDVLLNGIVTGATGGTWTTSGDGSFSPSNTSLTAAYTPGPNDLANGSVALTLTADGTSLCPGGTDNLTISISAGAPAQPNPITGAPISICTPFTGLVLSTNNDPSATSYNWTAVGLNNGITFNPPSTTNTITADFDSTPNSTYTIHVEAVNACGVSPYRSVNIRCKVGVPASVSGDAFACAGDVKNYTGTAVTGADNYTWTGPAGTLFDGNPTPYTTNNLTVAVTFPAGWSGGSICIAANVACYTSPTKCISVVSTPNQPGGVIGNLNVCPPQAGLTYFVPYISGLTYNWTVPPNTTLISGQGTNTIVIDVGATFVPGDITVTQSSSCATSVARVKTIFLGSGGNPVGKPSGIYFGQINNVCGNTFSYTALPLVANAYYNWTFPTGTLYMTKSANTVTVKFPNGGFNNSFIGVNIQSGCFISPERTKSILGAPLPPVVTGPSSVCANTGGYVYSIPQSTPATTVIWLVPPGATITSGQGTTSITVSFGNTPGNVYCTELNACGNSSGKVAVSITCRESESSIETARNINFNTYPNPASNNLTVEFNSNAGLPYQIKISDVTGRTVLVTKGITLENVNTQQFNVSSFSKGLYLVSLDSNGKTIQSRIAIE